MFTNSTITVTASVPNVRDIGSIYFFGIGYFQYKRLSDLPVGTSVIFWNVTFYSVSLNFTSSGCTINNITVSFPDGTSEQTGLGYCPTGGSDVVFTNHSNPKAGVILQGPYSDSFIAPGFYLLVEVTSFYYFVLKKAKVTITHEQLYFRPSSLDELCSGRYSSPQY